MGGSNQSYQTDFLKIRIKVCSVCSESKQALLDYPSKTLSSVISRQTTRGAERLPTANTGTAVPTSELESFGILQLYVTLQLYSFRHACTCASCTLFTGTSVYSERFRDNLPGLEEPSAAAIPDCFGSVSINRESDARQSIRKATHTSTRLFYTTSTC